MNEPAGLAPTACDVLVRDGIASLLRFRPSAARAVAGGRAAAAPVLLVPSLINRWYVLDLREGVSLARSLVDAGLPTYGLDWGIPRDEDRHVGWEDVLDRLARAVRRVRRDTGAERVSVLGYCMGGTLCAIHAALHPSETASFVDLAGPIDFAEAGLLGRFVDPRWFDASAIAAAGNVSPDQMQSGFVALRPTLALGKWVGFADRAHDPAARTAFDALERWSSDNIPFPARAYETYIRELYQDNRLVRGEHAVRGRRVDLRAITCPVRVVAADRDTICPLPAARALCDHVGATDRDVLVVPGGHVGAVVGTRAPTALYPRIADFFARQPCAAASGSRRAPAPA